MLIPGIQITESENNLIVTTKFVSVLTVGIFIKFTVDIFIKFCHNSVLPQTY